MFGAREGAGGTAGSDLPHERTETRQPLPPRLTHEWGRRVDSSPRSAEGDESGQRFDEDQALRALRSLSSRHGAGGSPDDIVGAYQREIGRVSLLSAELEVICAKRIERGLEAQRLLDETTEPGSVVPLSPAERRKLQREVREGLEGRDLLTEANLRLVVSIAKHYQNRGLPFLDLVQEGNIGLIRAVEKFD